MRLASRDVHAAEDKISRMEFLASGRARELLALLAPGRDRFGCQRLSGEPSLETQFLVGGMLEDGRAAVLKSGSRRPEPTILVRRTDTLIMGYENFLLLDGTVVWGYSVWVS